MSQSCSQLTTKLKHLQTLQGEFQLVLASYLQTGTDADKAKLEQLKQAIEIAKNEYERAGLVKVEWVNAYRTKHQIIAKQVIILEYIKKQIGGFQINSNQYGEVELLNINNNGSATPTINEALKFTNKLNGLKRFFCSNTQLSQLPKLPDSLQELFCHINPQLSELPKLPDSLQALNCSSNPQLSELPELPDSLQALNCSSNPQLSKLPELPNSLLGLYCHNNPLLSKLPKLPNSLQGLNCSNNPLLSKLPKLPNSLRGLNCSDNPQLTELPELPDGLQGLNCSNNPQLSELPKLPDSITYIDIRNTPAAQDPKVIAKLEEFKTKHPTAGVLY
ncbi:MAG: hypothetical protein A3J93_01925 [Candidatus Magasanikbacteria bacterium RIFOXYC2_FULL_42_28]|uniref:Uncharacterized protein n=1 Tax=Candidatus Magasanikbacteria bacterium RIFOXYC2_FULL_42_28 TaxID=1798704 RepID=A0A1F6NWL6_9BACT|nr:MAG: hypothetical protein A3J93_01920 [Candidatus Magasanikbacteria bacterium RIFOXYC2_FULL_42_28]OGH88259.1 MAG: hypothetical protein A3J93_01925 [Candidatus Magasanikbacteria bacterium RIFOXYC2_FULL_42_28]